VARMRIREGAHAGWKGELINELSSTTLARCARPARIDGDRSTTLNTSRSPAETSTSTVNGTHHVPRGNATYLA
jgi:hypothetical protein